MKTLTSLCGDESDDGVDDSTAAGAVAEVHVGILDFVLQQLVQLQPKLLEKLSHLHRNRQRSV